MEYFVTGNLDHDGKAYKRGDTVEISEGAAAQLLEVGVLQTEPVADAPAAAAPTEDKPAQPEVSGNLMETGEPSIDGRAPERQVDNAKDVTPPVDTGMRALSPDVRAGTDMAPVAGSDAPVEPTEAMLRPELEAMALAEGIDAKTVEDAPNKGALIDLINAIRDERQQPPPPEPANDPSAGL